MATSTPHYGLRKPDGADQVNVATDISANMAIIDTALFETAEAVAEVEVLPSPIGDLGEAVVVSGTDQVTSLTLSNGSANGGTFFLIVNGDPTSSIPWDVVADDLGSPIRDILGDETTSVAGGPLSSGFQITFVGPVGGFVVTVAADASGLTGPDAPYDITATDLQAASPHAASWGVPTPDLFVYSGPQIHLAATDPNEGAGILLAVPEVGSLTMDEDAGLSLSSQASGAYLQLKDSGMRCNAGSGSFDFTAEEVAASFVVSVPDDGGGIILTSGGLVQLASDFEGNDVGVGVNGPGNNIAVTTAAPEGEIIVQANAGHVGLVGDTVTIDTDSGFTFTGTTQTGVAVSTAAIHAALVALGLITA